MDEVFRCMRPSTAAAVKRRLMGHLSGQALALAHQSPVVARLWWPLLVVWYSNVVYVA